MFIMKYITLTLLLVRDLHCFGIRNIVILGEPRIVGGNFSKIQTIPYFAQLILKEKQICGATIISEYWLISAAHCFDNRRGLAILTGSHVRSKGELHKIKSVFIPDDYDPHSLNNDISLIKLKAPIQFNMNQKPIPIAFRPPQTWESILICGFGKENKYRGYSSDILKIAYAPVINQMVCAKQYYPNVITDNMFCAGVGITDACEGDSGGPAVIDNKLVGIVSWGQKCASKYFPGVYTKIHRYRYWIAKVTRIY